MAPAKMEASIAGRRIAADEPPYVIAEMSGNHNGDLNRALKLVEAAHRAGADAVKLQTYTADTITLDCDTPDFQIAAGTWAGRRLYDLYEEAHTPWDWHAQLFARAKELGITIFSSPFDATAIDFLEELGAPAYKIASFEVIDLPLIQRAAATGKPLIISTGAATVGEISEAVESARDAGAAEIVILHCASGYPTPPEEMNLRTIPHLRDLTGCLVGLSDHTLGIAVPIAAVAQGACLIEKHFTLARSDGGPDSTFSLEPDELAQMCQGIRDAHAALGGVRYDLTESERASLTFRRSLYIAEDVRAGETFTERNIRSVRPGRGLPPKHIMEIIGRKARRDAPKGTPLGWDLVD